MMDSGTAVGAIGIVVGIVITFWAARKYRKEKTPLFRMDGAVLVSRAASKYGPLQVSFAGRAVDQVTVTELCLFNAGREPIRADDLPSGLRIVTPCNAEILSCEVVRTTRPELKVGASEWVCKTCGQTCVTVDIPYLDQDDGVRLRIMHTSDSWRDLSVEGVVLGARVGFVLEDEARLGLGPFFRGRPRRVAASRVSRERRRVGAGVLLVVTGMAMVLWGVARAAGVPSDETVRHVESVPWQLCPPLGLLYLATGASLLRRRSRCPRSLWEDDSDEMLQDMQESDLSDDAGDSAAS